MAGIGFQLKELYNQSNFFSQLRAYGYSAITAVGPMFLTILLITATREWLLYLELPASEMNVFMAAVQYAFIFSQILTGGLVFVVSRYVADQTFMEKEENVLSSMYGAIALAVFIGFIAAILFYWSSPLSLLYKLITYLFFTELSIIWILSMYVSALKDFKKIVKNYLLGILVSAFMIWGLTGPLGFENASAVFLGLNVGFFLIAILLTRDIFSYFQINNKQYFHYLTYFEKHPYLFFIGLSYYIGLYGHNIAVWLGDRSIVIGETFLMAPYYDTPVFYAYLSVLPALILFMVTLETTFYTSYKKYYGRILNGFPLQDIDSARQEMYRVLKLEILFLAQVQLLVTFAFLFIGVRFLPFLGLTQDQIDIFMIVVLGSWFLSLMITMFLILLYFDERKSTFLLTASYAVLSFTLTIAAMNVLNLYGAGMFIASLAGAIMGSRLLVSRLNDIDYTTFCSQPIIYKESITRTERFLKRIGSLD
ncbi:putative membrane protein [Bacillus ectoiniformans]|uniref:exopolysaccharide Pel transporter PelG n=1 Tax=Bacillus ectoiniformans TaxID=1494429 RepID=UPI00195A1578|nr:exopolysaccharide Pel transporter PelG [Bacillus ectoiniformans]MBM7649091.1 putative membrane protein [Bacillus ectoiniformans]